MATKKKELTQVIYQIKVTLLGTSPPIWRRLLVPAELTLGQFHDVLQAAMGWQNCHLHEFHIGRQRFGIPDPNDRLMDGPTCVNERKVRLSDVFQKAGTKAEYMYDFGDSWEHAIVVENVVTPEPGVAYPRCAEGERHGPPEDCGGIGGFYNFLEAIRDPEHDEHEDLLEWIGGSFDPELFSYAEVNERLERIFRPVRRTAARRSATKPKPARKSKLDPPVRVGSLFTKPGISPPERKRIRPDEKVPLELNDRERELIVKHTFAGDELTRRLRVVPKPGESATYRFTLDDLDELAGYVAAEANHAKNKKLQKELQGLFQRIAAVLDSYTDEAD
jgi:hypothetical protein